MRALRFSCLRRLPDQLSHSRGILGGKDLQPVSIMLCLRCDIYHLSQGRLTIHERVKNVLSVLLHQVVDVSENTTGYVSTRFIRFLRRCRNSPHLEVVVWVAD